MKDRKLNPDAPVFPPGTDVPGRARRRWLRKLKRCPVFVDPEGARMIVLPNGAVYAVAEMHLAQQVIDALTDAPEATMRIAVLRCLTTPEEWAEAERIVDALGSEIAKARADTDADVIRLDPTFGRPPDNGKDAA